MNNPFIFNADPSLPHSMADIALYLVLFFLVVGLLALFTAWATNFYYRLHLTRMKYTLERRKRLEKLYTDVFNKPMLYTQGTEPPEFHIDPEYLAHLNSMSPKERDKHLYGSFDAK
jgi:hypothetical protein